MRAHAIKTFLEATFSYFSNHSNSLWAKTHPWVLMYMYFSAFLSVISRFDFQKTHAFPDL